MKTIEQIKKIKAVVLYVLNNMPKGVDYIKLSKLLYFAQRESLVSYGKLYLMTLSKQEIEDLFQLLHIKC